MRIKKIIPITLDVLNPNDIYRPYMETAMKLLREKFEHGMCFSGCFIEEVTKIVRISLPCSNKNRNDGRMSIDVLFEANCIIYVRGEIIPDVTITSFLPSGDTSLPSGYVGHDAEHPKAYVSINKPKGQAYQEKMKGPVIVQGAEYPISHPATINAIAFQPIQRKVYMFKCLHDLDDVAVEHLQHRVEVLRELSDTLATLSEGKDKIDQVAYFYKLLYPYSKAVDISGATGKFKMINVMDWTTLENGKSYYVVKPIELGYASTKFLVQQAADEKIPPTLDKVVKYLYSEEIHTERLLAVLDSICNIIEMELSSIISLMEAYPIKDLEKYKSFFSNYIRMKKGGGNILNQSDQISTILRAVAPDVKTIMTSENTIDFTKIYPECSIIEYNSNDDSNDKADMLYLDQPSDDTILSIIADTLSNITVLKIPLDFDKSRLEKLRDANIEYYPIHESAFMLVIINQ